MVSGILGTKSTSPITHRHSKTYIIIIVITMVGGLMAVISIPISKIYITTYTQALILVRVEINY